MKKINHGPWITDVTYGRVTLLKLCIKWWHQFHTTLLLPPKQSRDGDFFFFSNTFGKYCILCFGGHVLYHRIKKFLIGSAINNCGILSLFNVAFIQSINRKSTYRYLSFLWNAFETHWWRKLSGNEQVLKTLRVTKLDLVSCGQELLPLNEIHHGSPIPALWDHETYSCAVPGALTYLLSLPKMTLPHSFSHSCPIPVLSQSWLQIHLCLGVFCKVASLE